MDSLDYLYAQMYRLPIGPQRAAVMIVYDYFRKSLGADDQRTLIDRLEALIRIETGATENEILRKLLWIRHHPDTAGLYGDDGEMQCAKCMIDFRRDPAWKIDERFREIDLQKLRGQRMADDKRS